VGDAFDEKVRGGDREAWPALARTAAAIVAAAGLGLIAACGSSPASQVAQLGTTTTQSSSPGSPHDQALAFAGCMHTHGVPLWPEPASNGTFDKSNLTPAHLGVGSSLIAAAEQACRSLLPTYSATPRPGVLAQALRFSQCMRAHGATDFPDPESNGAIAIPHAMENSPAYLAALHFCVHKYGVPPPPSPAGGGR
jgi:hypothetical protein